MDALWAVCPCLRGVLGGYERVPETGDAAAASFAPGGPGGPGPASTVLHEPSKPRDIGVTDLSNGSRSSFMERYELKETIGIGSTSTCYRCVAHKTRGEFGVKIVDKRKIESEYRGLMQQFYNEVNILKTLRHPNIIRLEEVIESETKIYIVMELMRGGELFDYIVARGKLREDEAQRIARKIISAVAYMHSQDIIHRDLKPENLLLTTQGPNYEVKLIDFGLSKCMHGREASSFLGTKGYLAPEMLQRERYSKAVDCWALGIIVFILLCGCLPFDDDTSASDQKLIGARFALRFPQWAQNLSAPAKELLRGLLNVNPRQRFTAQDALDHKWVRGIGTPKANATFLQSPRILGAIRTPRAGGPARPDVRARQRANEDRFGAGGRAAHESGAGWQYYAQPSEAAATVGNASGIGGALAQKLQSTYTPPARMSRKRPSF